MEKQVEADLKVWSSLDGGLELNFYATPIKEFLSWCRRANISDSFKGWVCIARVTGQGIRHKDIIVAREGLRLAFVFPENKYSEDQPDIKLIVGYNFTRRFEFVNIIDQAVERVKTLFDVIDYHIARLDVSVTVNKNFCEFYLDILNNHFDVKSKNVKIIGRVVKSSLYESSLGSQLPKALYYGNEEIQGVIYDKTDEVLEQGTEEKREDLLNRFGSLQNLTRIEWRLKRRWLKRYGLNTATDIKNNWSALVDNLSNWMRFVDNAKRHKCKQKLLDYWKLIKDNLLDKPNIINKNSALKRLPKKYSGKYIRLLKMACSLLTTACAAKYDNLEDAIKEAVDLILVRFYDHYNKKFEVRRSILGVGSQWIV